jgi:hypothetical protein
MRAASRDRARGTPIGIACELRWEPGRAVLELTAADGPRIRVEPGDADPFRPAPFGVLQLAARRPRRAPQRRRGRLRVHHALRARPRTDRRTSRAAARAARKPDGAPPLQQLPGEHHLLCGSIRHPLPGRSRTRRVLASGLLTDLPSRTPSAQDASAAPSRRRPARRLPAAQPRPACSPYRDDGPDDPRRSSSHERTDLTPAVAHRTAYACGRSANQHR